VKRLVKFLKLFFKGAVGDPFEKVEYMEGILNDQLLTVILSERLGIPNPMYYYLVELLPYLGEEIPNWEVRSSNRKTILDRALKEFGEP